MASQEEDDLETTMASGCTPTVDAPKEIRAVLDDLEILLKNGDVIAALTGGGINASLALVAVQGLRSLLAGEKRQAADDFDTVAEELRSRSKRTRGGRGS